MNRNKLPLKSWSIKASCFHYLAYCGIMCSATAATQADICEIRVLVGFFFQQCDGAINVFISEPNQTKCRPIRRCLQDETLICFILCPTHHSGIIMIDFSLFINKNPMCNIVGYKMTMIKCRWGVKQRLRVKMFFFILHISSVLTILENSNPHMKVKAVCTMFLLRIMYFF